MPNIILTNYFNNCQGDWGHQLRRGKRKGSIRIIFQNIGGIGNVSDKPSQHKLYTLKKIMFNEVISLVGLAEVNSNWIKITIKVHIYNRSYGWFKIRSISTGYNWVTTSEGPFQSGGTAIMVVDEVSCRAISICQ